jgi:hypothetical protein
MAMFSVWTEVNLFLSLAFMWTAPIEWVENGSDVQKLAVEKARSRASILRMMAMFFIVCAVIIGGVISIVLVIVMSFWRVNYRDHSQKITNWVYLQLLLTLWVSLMVSGVSGVTICLMIWLYNWTTSGAFLELHLAEMIKPYSTTVFNKDVIPADIVLDDMREEPVNVSVLNKEDSIEIWKFLFYNYLLVQATFCDDEGHMPDALVEKFRQRGFLQIYTARGRVTSVGDEPLKTMARSLYSSGKLFTLAALPYTALGSIPGPYTSAVVNVADAEPDEPVVAPVVALDVRRMEWEASVPGHTSELTRTIIGELSAQRVESDIYDIAEFRAWCTTEEADVRKAILVVDVSDQTYTLHFARTLPKKPEESGSAYEDVGEATLNYDYFRRLWFICDVLTDNTKPTRLVRPWCTPEFALRLLEHRTSGQEVSRVKWVLSEVDTGAASDYNKYQPEVFVKGLAPPAPPPPKRKGFQMFNRRK